MEDIKESRDGNDLNALFDAEASSDGYRKKQQRARFAFHAKTLTAVFLMSLLTLTTMLFMVHQERRLTVNVLKQELRLEVESASRNVAHIFENERIFLHAAAFAVDVFSPRSIQNVLKGSHGLARTGAVNFDGKILVGSTLDPLWEPEIKKAFAGISGSVYRPGLGFMFTEPVIKDGRISCVFYALFSEEALRINKPAIARNKGIAQVMFDQRVISSNTVSEKKQEFFLADGFADILPGLQAQLKSKRVVVQEYDEDGHEGGIFYAAEIPNTPFYIRVFFEEELFSSPFIKVLYCALALMLILIALSFVIMHYLGLSLCHELMILGRQRFVKVASEIRRRAATAVVRHTVPRIDEIIKSEQKIKQYGHDPQMLETLYQSFEDNAKGLQHTLKSIVDLSGIEKGFFNLNEHEYDLKAMLERQARMVQRKAAEKGLNFTLETDPGLPRVVYGDEQCVSEIIEHLLDNAVRYTAQGAVGFKVTGDLSKDSETVMLRITVSDTGSGIEEGLRTRIFRDLPRRMLEEGRSLPGFGLAICRSFLKLMGGFIDVQTTLGKGSTITASVPQKVRSHMIMGTLQLPPLPKLKPQEQAAVKLGEIINQGAGIDLSSGSSSNSLEQSQEVIPVDMSLKRGGGVEVMNGAVLQEAAKTQEVQEKGAEILDIDGALAGFNHDMTRYLQSCELFCHVSDDRRIKIAQAYASADWKRYAMLMCSLKNSAGSLGAYGIKTLAAQLESAARIVSSTRSDYIKLRPQGLNFITSRHEQCLKQYEELLKTIHSSLNI